jgi:hypothetical protein
MSRAVMLLIKSGLDFFVIGEFYIGWFWGSKVMH